MSAQSKCNKAKRISRISVLTTALVLAALAATLGWAGILQNDNGDSISRDLVAPAGAGRATDAAGNTIDSAAGQIAGKISTAPSGRQLYHGAHGPLSLTEPPPPPAAAENWERYE